MFTSRRQRDIKKTDARIQRGKHPQELLNGYGRLGRHHFMNEEKSAPTFLIAETSGKKCDQLKAFMLSVTQHILDICIIVMLCNSVIVLNPLEWGVRGMLMDMMNS